MDKKLNIVAYHDNKIKSYSFANKDDIEEVFIREQHLFIHFKSSRNDYYKLIKDDVPIEIYKLFNEILDKTCDTNIEFYLEKRQGYSRTEYVVAYMIINGRQIII